MKSPRELAEAGRSKEAFDMVLANEPKTAGGESALFRTLDRMSKALSGNLKQVAQKYALGANTECKVEVKDARVEIRLWLDFGDDETTDSEAREVAEVLLGPGVTVGPHKLVPNMWVANVWLASVRSAPAYS